MIIEFPLDKKVSDEDERNELIFDILVHCAKYGYPPSNVAKYNMEPINFNINSKIEKEVQKIFKKQLPALGKIASKDEDLMKYFSVNIYWIYFTF